MQDESQLPTDPDACRTPAGRLPDACRTLIVEQARALLEIQKSKENLSKENSELKLQIDKLHEVALWAEV